MSKTVTTPYIRISIIIAAVVMSGTVGYMVIEGWGVLDSLFMTIITVATIGYGEIHPLSAAGRIFTILLIAGGLGAAASALAALGTFLIETAASGAGKRRKTMRAIEKMKDHWVLCGYGRTGMAVALKLAELEIPFVVLENSEDNCERAVRSGFLALCEDASKDASLENAGVRRCAGVLVMVSDFSTAVVITMAVRELRPEAVIVVRGDDSSIEDRLKRAGADIVVYPLQLGGERVAAIAAKHSGIDPSETRGAASTKGYRFGLYKNYGSVPLPVREALARSNGISAVAKFTPSGEREENPPLDSVLATENSLVVVLSLKNECSERDGFRTEWSEKMSVGVPMFDEEHRGLIGLINALSDIVCSGAGPDEACAVFDRLVQYTVSHFRNEEAFLKSIRYPDLESHIREHERLTRTVMELNKDRQAVFPDNVAEFLISWLNDHIQGSDKKYAEFAVSPNRAY
jgi:hemerythrin-like metal-binding protein